MTESNYEKAKNILCKRYGRKEVIIFAHIQSLLGLEVPASSSDAVELAKYYDKLVANVRALDAMGINSDSFGVILTPIIVSRLHENMRMEWSRDSEGKEADLDYLMEFLDREIKCRERCVSFGGLEQKREGVKVAVKQKQFSSAAALHSSSSHNPKLCGFCDRKHPSEKCFKYLKLGVKERQSFTLRRRLCFKCLCKDHIAVNCSDTCKHCGGNHHVTLCFKQADASSRSGSEGESVSEEKQSSSSSVSLTVSNSNHDVCLLPTASVKVKCKDGSWRTATLLFDGGSERSFVSQTLVKQMEPDYVRSSEVSFSTFGGRSHGSRSKVFSVTVSDKYKVSHKTVELTEVPVICLPLSRPSVSS